MSEKKFVLYKHTCPNGKVYIGITCQKPQIRWNYGKGYQKNKHF
jgi:predicted GIY-YIG superfamily endonuclease